MTLSPVLIFLGGLIVIVVGAELVLRHASRLAALLGVPPIVIGLTVVSVGTSVPELAVGITAAIEGKGTLAVGNIAGTNIFNILFILGFSAMLRPLPVQLQTVRFDVPSMIVTATLLAVMALDGMLGRLDGFILLMGAALYTFVLARLAKKESKKYQKEFSKEYGVAVSGKTPANLAFHGLLLTGGMGITVLGAELLVAGAEDIALLLGVPDTIVGLTIVAMGTSAPELATTVVATLKNERDVAIGNLLGSSIYNVLVILGLTCMAAPAGLVVTRDIMLIDLPLAALVALICAPVFKSERLVSRAEGLAFVTFYLLYLISIVWIRA